MSVENESKELDFSNSVLDPNHPLLEPFQKALKEHLLFQIHHLKEELIEIEENCKITEAEIVEVGVKAYEAQQHVCSQQKTVENIVKELEEVAAAQAHEDEELEKNKKQIKNIQDKVFQTEKSNRELLNEIESITSLTQQLSQSEIKIESHININKRLADKTRQENQKLADEKRRQDYFIHQLLSEIWKLESDKETIKIQLSVKEDEMEELEQKVALGSTNISALQSEIKGLMFSWNSVVVAVGHRDKGLECLNEELKKFKEKYKNKQPEIQLIRKLIKKELVKNEISTLMKEKITKEMNNYQGQLDEELDRRNLIEKDIFLAHAHMEEMEKDIKACQTECHMKQFGLTSLTGEYNKHVKKKAEMEEKILAAISSEISNNEYGKKARKLLREIVGKRGDVKLILREAENKKTNMFAELESEKFNIEELTRLNNDEKVQQEQLDKEVKKILAEKDKFELLYRKREKQVLSLNDKLEERLSTAEQDKISDEELRIMELTKLIEESQQSIKNLQVFWLREQNSILVVSNERQEQIQNISLLKKQVLILEQKNLRISDDIEELKKREEKSQHQINMLINKASLLCEHLFKKRTHKTDLDRNNALLQGDYDSRLHDAELQLLQLEAEIADIEDAKLALSKELVELNREGLEWEKKFIMATEAVTNSRETRKRGPIATMRAEIHRMEVIYAHLKKAQDKLLRDMEQCVLRRDAMYLKAEGKQMLDKAKNISEKTRIHFQKKIDNMKNQIKRTKNDVSAMKQKAKDTEAEVEKFKTELKKIKRQNVFDKNYLQNLDQKLEETKINRQFKFELLVFQQRKANMYELIVKNRKPYTIYRKEQQLINEYNAAKEINNKLIKIIEELKRNFAERSNDLVKISNTLGIVALCMYT